MHWAQEQPRRGPLLNRALRLHRQGALAKAAKLYAEILRCHPQDVETLHLSGLLHYQQGRLDESLRLTEAALRIDCNAAQAWLVRGLVLEARGRFEDALASYERGLLAQPRHAEMLNNRGNVLMRLSRWADAVASFEQALAIKGDYVDALFNRGTALLELDRAAEALGDFDRALAIKPDDFEALGNRGNALMRLNRPDEALMTYAAALAIAPDHPRILTNRSDALRRLDRPAEALASVAKALAVSPGNPEAHFEKGLTLLSLGEFEAGWKAYEWRWSTARFSARRRDFSAPLWRGDRSLAGKTILLHAEQGFGDTIQFARYVPLVARLGGKVVLEVQPALRTLLSSLEGVDRIVERGEKLPDFDLHCPLLSLPLAFKTDVATVPADIPYVRVPDDRIDRWRNLMAATAPRVGLVWSGRPSHANDRNRSIELRRLEPVLAINGVQLVSLQREVRPWDIEVLDEHPGLLRLGDRLRDFVDTGAVISLLDVVISVDTAVAHLAGAMGKPVLVLLPFAADFRWMREREDSPWYPTARLLRQPEFDDWESVVARIAEEIGRLRRQHISPAKRREEAT